MKRIPRAGDILKIVRTRQQDSTTINSCWLPPTESREYVYSELNGGGTWYVHMMLRKIPVCGGLVIQ